MANKKSRMVTCYECKDPTPLNSAHIGYASYRGKTSPQWICSDCHKPDFLQDSQILTDSLRSGGWSKNGGPRKSRAGFIPEAVDLIKYRKEQYR